MGLWSKCKLYCVPSLMSIIAGWDILFSLFCFSIYFLKAWFLVEKGGFWVIIFSARKWRERRILHHIPKTPSGSHHFRLATPLDVSPCTDAHTRVEMVHVHVALVSVLLGSKSLDISVIKSSEGFILPNEVYRTVTCSIHYYLLLNARLIQRYSTGTFYRNES